MLGVAAALGAVVAAWFITRWSGRGKPCPVTLAAFFDNRVVSRLSGVEMLLDHAGVRDGMRVLDAGCGPGRLTIPAARRVGETGEVVALDVQEGMLERVRRNAARASVRNVRTVKAALGQRTLSAEGAHGFDRILLVTVLGEIPDAGAALKELYAVLKPDGQLSITEMIVDPDFLTKRRVLELAAGAGFQLDGQFGSALAFTVNFRRSLAV
jgi:ubiquinone/menaquinone biosynthesis C-methylase UbiE